MREQLVLEHARVFDFVRAHIRRVLRTRLRYRYVRPQVLHAEAGWRIVSPCCSRNVDSRGGLIDIAWIEPLERGYRLHARDHENGCWIAHADSEDLSVLLDALRLDPQRRFWP